MARTKYNATTSADVILGTIWRIVRKGRLEKGEIASVSGAPSSESCKNSRETNRLENEGSKNAPVSLTVLKKLQKLVSKTKLLTPTLRRKKEYY